MTILTVALIWFGVFGSYTDKWKRHSIDIEEQKNRVVAKMNWVLGQEKQKIVPWSLCSIITVWDKNTRKIVTVLECSDKTTQSIILANQETEGFVTAITDIAVNLRWELDSRRACLRMRAKNPDNPNWDEIYVISNACATT